MKRLKKPLAVLLVVITLLSTFSITAFAAEYEISKFRLTKGEELNYGYSYFDLNEWEWVDEPVLWGYTNHELTVSRDGYGSKTAYCIDANLPAPPTGNYHITTSTVDIKDIATPEQYKMICKALYYCYGGAGYTQAKSSYAFGVDTERHAFKYKNNPHTMDCFMGNVCYNAASKNVLGGVSGKNLVYNLSHRVLSYICSKITSLGTKDTWDFRLPPDPKTDANYNYWMYAVQDVYDALKKAPDVPLYSSIYLCSFGSSYQRLLIPFDGITLQIKKSSANPEMTNGNSCYSLEGAVYNVYSDKSCTNYVGNITTNANGTGYLKDSNGNARIVPKQTYYVKESKAPKGYALDKTVYSFPTTGYTYNNHIVCEISCKDVPLNDPVLIELYKEDAVTHERTKALAGAEFTVKYYNGYYNTPAEAKTATPARSWVIKTDEYGFAALDKDCLISGDEFYYKDGYVTLPLGTLTIQETKAPDGYKITEEVYLGQVVAGTYGMKWITGNITEDNNILVEEQQSNGYIGVHKVNQDNEPVEGAVYGLYTSSEADSNGMLLESNRVATITTDVNGNGTFDYASPVGTTVYVQEITAPVGYELDRKVYETSPSAENVEITNPAIVNVVENVVTGNIKVVKTSDDGIVDNFWFSITDSNGKTYDNIRTQNGGIAELKNLPVYNKDKSLISYTVDELGFKQTDGTYSLPVRYIKPEAVTQTLVDNDTVTFGFNNAVKVGVLQIKKSSDDGIVENVWFRVTASNGKQYDDVCTDSSGAISMNNLPIYDYSGNKIEYTVEELGFKNSDGEYYFPKKYLSQSIRSTILTENVYTVVSFSNETDYRGIQIKKTAYDGETDGLWFNVTDSLGNDYGNFETESGTAEINDLSIYDINDNLISYTITELGLMNDDGSFYLPERYIKTEPQTVTLDNTLESSYYKIANFYNDYKLANIQIQKTSEDDVVEGIWFNISTTDGADCGNYQTDENGTIFETGFDIYDWDDNKITYVIKELGVKKDDGSFEVPYRYNTPKTQKLTLNYGEIGTVNFNNTLKKGSVSLTKTNDKGTKLNGVNYKLYDKSGAEIMLSQTGSSSYQYNTKGKALTLSTVNGKIFVNNLPQGDYYFIETKCPAGYSLLKEPIYFTISGENESTLYRTIDVTDAKKVIIPFTGGIDSDSGNKPLQFGILLAAAGLLACGVFIYRKHKSNKNNKNNTKRKGNVKMKKFTKRAISLTLMVMMVISMMCVGFTANAAVNPANIDYSKKGTVTFYKYEMADVSTAVGGATGEVTDIDKVPSDAKPLADVEFTMYRVAELTDYFKTDGLALPTVDEAKAKVVPGTQKYVQKTDATGMCKFTNLPLAIYLVEETDCPAQVTQTTPSFVLSVPMTNSTHTGWNYDIYSFPKNQTAYSGVNLKKINPVNDEAIKGAEFKLQESTDGVTYTDRIAKMVTNDIGMITVENLPSNMYYRFVETKAASDEWILDSTVSYDFYIDGTGDVLVDDEVVENKTIEAGNEKPEIHKYVLDGEEGTKGIDNTANYGDTVYWEITTSIPSIVEKMNTYKIVDTMSAGLKYTGATVKVDGTNTLTESTDYTVSQDGLNVTFDIKPESLAGGSEVEVFFNTELTSDAPLGTDIPNTSMLIYNNNIGVESTYTINSETPNVHTGGYSFTKTNGTKGLQGAEFVLYKTEADAQANTNAVDTQVSDENGLVSFKGLEYGGFSADEETKAANGTANGSTDYWIVETKAPNGYILFKDPIKITVNATSHNAANTDNVVNTPKFETPKTGGTMTNVTFIGSVLLLVGAGMFLATRRKKSSTKN